MGLKDLARKADIIGPNFNITLNESSRLRSLFGAVLSVCFIASLLLVNILYIKDFIIKGKPTVIKEEQDFPSALQLNWTSVGAIPFFTFYLNENAQGMPEMFNASEAKRLVNAVLKVSDQRSAELEIEEYYFSRPCADIIDGKSKHNYNYLKDYENYEEILPILRNNALCFDADPNELWMEGDRYSNTNRRLSIRLMGCVQALAQQDGGSCLPDSEHVDFYLETTIRVIFPRFVTSMANNEKPIKKIYDINNPFLIREFSLDRSDYFVVYNNSVYDESQYFSDSHTHVTNFYSYELATPKISARKTGYNFICKLDKYYTGDCPFLGRLAFWTSNKSSVYTRRYISLMDMIGSVGGITSILFQIFILINCGYMFFTEKDVMLSHLIPTFKSKTKSMFRRSSTLATDESKNTKTKDAKETKEAKKLQKEKWDKLRDDANEMILSSCDLASLLEELALLKVWTRFMFDNSQRELMVLCALELFREDRNLKEKKIERSSTIEAFNSRRVTKIKKEQNAHKLIMNRVKESRNAKEDKKEDSERVEILDECEGNIRLDIRRNSLIDSPDHYHPTNQHTPAQRRFAREYIANIPPTSYGIRGARNGINHSGVRPEVEVQNALPIREQNIDISSARLQVEDAKVELQKGSTIAELDPHSRISQSLDKFLLQKIALLDIDYLPADTDSVFTSQQGDNNSPPASAEDVNQA